MIEKHLYNKWEYGRRVTSGEIDTTQYYNDPHEIEINKAKTIISRLFTDHYERVLDVGCSLGFYSFMFANKQRFVVGTDYELHSLRTATKQQQFRKKHIKYRPCFVNADALHLPFKEKKFDVISNVDFIEHIIHQHQPSIIKEMHRILKDGGKIYTYTPNYVRLRMEYYINKIRYALKGQHFSWQEDRPYKDNPDLQNHQDTLLHVGLLSFDQVKKLFIQEGFVVDTVLYSEYSIPFFTSLTQKCIQGLGIQKPPFYALFCSNTSIIFRKKPKKSKKT